MSVSMARSRKKIGEILIAQGVLDEGQVQSGLKKAQEDSCLIGEALVELGLASEHQVLKALAVQHGIKYVDLTNEKIAKLIDKDAIDKSVMKKHLVLGMGKSGGKMRVAIHDPNDLQVLDNLRFVLNCDVEPLLATKSQLRDIISGGEATSDAPAGAPKESLLTDSIDRAIDRSVDRSMDKSIDVSSEDSPIVKLVNRVLDEAVRMRTSDIHVGPMGDRVRLRYRVDGVCSERDNLPKRMQNAVLSCLKLMAGMNISEKRIPQDGRIKIFVDDVPIDFRVSACPTYHGESVVLRILRPDAVRIGLANLGFEQENLDVFNRIIKRPNGIFLVTGPTGSGKTTTLYSALDVLNRPDKKIITAEDPVEYNFEGINQCQIREDIGFTFPSVLRSMLRQAPNIILVGEMRDHETASMGIQASLTGHLVFSTLHTNDAPSAVTRMVDMGVPGYLVASSVVAVMGQRLVRTICKRCKTQVKLSEAVLSDAGIPPEVAEKATFAKGKGCGYCQKSGYRGRMGIYELMVVSSRVRELMFQAKSTVEIQKQAISEGMTTLYCDGVRKAMRGYTTLEEVYRVAKTTEQDKEALQIVFEELLAGED